MSDNTKEKLVDYFRHLIMAFGNDAFAPRGSILLYSGPSKTTLSIADIPFVDANINKTRGERTIAILNAHRLDETAAGNLLFDKLDIYKTMTDLAGPSGNDYANAINFEVSRMFTQQAEGRVYTAVCGAAKDRIFYTAELPELIANKEISHINGYEADRFRRLYDIGPDRAFDHICQTEQRLVFAIAQNTGSRPAFLDHAERRDLRRASKRGLRDDSGALIMGQVLDGVSRQAREDFATAKLEMLAAKRSQNPNFYWKKNLLAGTQLG